MQVRYVAIWKLRGANTIESRAVSHTLAEISDPKIAARMTIDPDPHFLHIDRFAAIATGLLSGMFARGSEGTLDERLAAKIEDIKARRARQSGSGVFLVFEGETDIPAPDFSNRRDTDAFAMCFDAADKAAIREQFRPFMQAVFTALALNLPENADRQIEKLGDVIYLIDAESGKPIYSFTVEFGDVRISVATSVTDDVAAEAARHALRIVGDRTLAKPASLLVTSLNRSNDSLQVFIAAWSALEIFVNATFKATYQTRWFAIMENGAPVSAKPVFERFKDVMRDKYRLADKFLIIASVLDADGADTDAAAFRGLKETRDSLFHALDTPANLPTEVIQKLLLKYMKLHLNSLT